MPRQKFFRKKFEKSDFTPKSEKKISRKFWKIRIYQIILQTPKLNTMNKDLLNEARIKQRKRNSISNSDYELKISDFILKIHNVCAPCTYGKLLPKKIQYDSGPFLRSTDKDLLSNRGDLHINKKVFFEVKTSIINKDGKYSITNIRGWQEFNYFILCFVDMDFTASFFCVPKKSVTDNPHLKLNAMNDTEEINKQNTYVGKRVSFHSYDLNYIFKKHNVLKGTSYKHLLVFLKTFKHKK